MINIKFITQAMCQRQDYLAPEVQTKETVAFAEAVLSQTGEHDSGETFACYLAQPETTSVVYQEIVSVMYT